VAGGRKVSQDPRKPASFELAEALVHFMLPKYPTKRPDLLEVSEASKYIMLIVRHVALAIR
jgi:hypothetical protein